MQIHKILPKTYANGPGLRYCIWVQGCSMKCEGCINPETHNPYNGFERSIKELYSEIASFQNEIEGISISGGEPLQQVNDTLNLIKLVKENLGKTVILWTGYDESELEKLGIITKLRKYVDVLIVGRYIKSLHKPSGLKGSKNQKYLFFSNKYTEFDLKKIPKVEIQFDKNEIIITGIKKEIVDGWFE